MTVNRTGIREIYLEAPPEEIVYIQAIFESYEGVAIVRTAERKRAVLVLLVAEDFLSTAWAILDALKNEVAWTPILRPADLGEDWLMRELAIEEAAAHSE